MVTYWSGVGKCIWMRGHAHVDKTRPSPWHWTKNVSEWGLKLFRLDFKAESCVPVGCGSIPGRGIVCVSHPGASHDAPKWLHPHCLPPSPKQRTGRSVCDINIPHILHVSGALISLETKRRGMEVKTVFIWVCHRHSWMSACSCDVCQYQRGRASYLVSPQIQHSTVIDPSLQLTARFVPNQFLSPSSVPLSVYLSPSAFPFLHFSHYPLPPSHAPTSHPKVSGVTPSKVIRKQQLVEKSILYQQATTGFCTYPIWSLW